MGKFKHTGTINTYGKKKKTSTTVNNVNIVNVTNHHYYVINNYINITKSPPKEEKCHNRSKESTHDSTNLLSSSNSISGDEFDKVLKGPIYNPPHKPCTSTSGDAFDHLLKGNAAGSSYAQSPSGFKYFIRRQDTINSYCSDGSSVKSDVSSVHLFKDCSSSLSCLYSPLHNLIPTGQSKNNKWVVSSTNLKKTDYKCKKKVKRNNKTNSSTKRKLRSKLTMSSTPTHPDSTKCMVSHVSPIFPPLATTFDHNQSVADMFESADSDDEAEQPQPTLGISALAQQFGDLWRVPSDNKNIGDHSDSNTEELGVDGANHLENEAHHTSRQIDSVHENNKDLVQNVSLNDFNESLKLDNTHGQSKECVPEKNVLLSSLNQSFHGFDCSDINRPAVNNQLQTSLRDDIQIDNSYFDNKENRKLETNFSNVNVSEKENLTTELSLLPGKQWRRSFLKRKKSEIKRSTIDPGLKAKLIKEACSYVESSSRHSYTSSRYFERQNDLIQNNVNEDSSNMSSAMFNSYLLPSSPEMNYRISFRVKGKNRKNLFCNNSNNMDNILEESVVDEEKSFNDSSVNSTELFAGQFPFDTISVSSTNGKPIGNVECSGVGSFVFLDNPEDLDPVIENTSLNKTHSMCSSDNCKTNNSKYEPNYLKNDISQMSPSLNETCPLMEMPGLLNTITKRKKPDFKNSLTGEDLALSSPLEYSFNEDEDVVLRTTPSDCVLMICHQGIPLSFLDVFSEQTLLNSEKIGEGVYGEVFMLNNSDNERSVLKIIPVEGSCLVNNERQKKFEEVLSELVVTQQLSLLRENEKFRTSGYCLLKNLYCLKGEYPPTLIKHWEKFNKEKKSENDCPDIFDEQQLYIALELEHAGKPIESFSFPSAKQAYSVFLQISFSLSIAEMALEFEHRDLHVGNVLLSKTTDEYVGFIYNDECIKLHTYGLKATIIDFTLSRVSYKDDVLFFDLASDPELFTAQGDYQFEVYRLMKSDVNNQWRVHAPVTNIRWLYYLADKLVVAKYSCKKSLRIHSQYLKKLENIKHIIEDFSSSAEFVNNLMNTETYDRSIIRGQL